jgi:hypothetical protein
MEVPGCPVVVELADVVDGEQVSGPDHAGADGRVEVDRQDEPPVPEPGGVDGRLGGLDDRTRGDDHVRPLDGCPRIGHDVDGPFQGLGS